MNDILKQRLVGAMILVALGVVFWPIIFVQPDERLDTVQGRIPPTPDIDTTPIEPPAQGELRASPGWEPEADEDPGEWTVEDATPEPADAEVHPEQDPAPLVAPPADRSRGRTTAPEQPALDDRGVPVAWILQVASVSTAAKAEELRDRLLAMNEKAYIKKIEQGEKDLYRVYIGPNFERANLEKIQAAVDARFKVKSMIVRYLP